MTTEPKEKQVLLTVGNVRVKEYDSMNVIIERFEEYTQPPRKKGETAKLVSGWRFKGYSDSVLKALLSIQRKELLIDYNAVSDLESYLKQVLDSNGTLLTALEDIS